MGAWGYGSFDNDAAMDWVAELNDAEDEAFLRDSLADGVDEDALAAAEVVAALRGNPVDKLPDDVKKWIRLNAVVVTDDLLRAAREAVVRVKDDSELKDLWEASTWLEIWYEAIDDLLRRLQPL